VKRKFQMKTKMFLSLLLLATVVPGALAAADEAETKAHSRTDSVLVSPVEDPAVTNALTQKFSATLRLQFVPID
jgi:hypothetical protein